MTAILAGDLAAARLRLDQAASGFRAIGVVRGEAWAMYYLAQAEMSTTGREHVARALQLFETPPEDPLGIAWSLTLAGTDLIYTNELSKARIVLERAVDVAVENDITHALGGALTNLGLVQAREGRIEQARALTAEGVELYRALGDTYQLMDALGNQSQVEMIAGSLDVATELSVEALGLTADLGTHAITHALVMTAELLRRRGDHIGAAHAYHLARRTWPNDKALFEVAAGFAVGDLGPLETLPPSRMPIPPSVRQRVDWALRRLNLA